MIFLRASVLLLSSVSSFLQEVFPQLYEIAQCFSRPYGTKDTHALGSPRFSAGLPSFAPGGAYRCVLRGQFFLASLRLGVNSFLLPYLRVSLCLGVSVVNLPFWVAASRAVSQWLILENLSGARNRDR